jgi:pimeloyl-ACP methyl ester carboxylesterase
VNPPTERTSRRSPSLAAVVIPAVAAILVGCGGEQGATAKDRPDQLVQISEGRRLNFHCTGRGAPLVILESGYGAGVNGWLRVQPQIAKTTRVCSYDRAGYGFSDPGPLPRDGAATARDLDQALDAAGLQGPYVVVGFSAGGLYSRLFAARRPGEVQGLVLLDPTVERVAPSREADGLQSLRRTVTRCLATAELDPTPPATDPRWSGCLPRRGTPEEMTRLRPAEAWRNQLSELDSIFSDTSVQVQRLGTLLHDVPIYVITASETAATSPTVGYGRGQSVWELQHLRLALSSDRGFQRTILSSHQVPADRPEVVAETVVAMVTAVRAGKPPEPLPVSETAPPEGDAAFPESPR